MYKIDSGDAVTTQPSRPAQGAAKFFANRTIVPAWWLNMVQNELWNVLVRFGITPSKSNDNQLADAIQAARDAAKSEAVAQAQKYRAPYWHVHGHYYSTDVRLQGWKDVFNATSGIKRLSYFSTGDISRPGYENRPGICYTMTIQVLTSFTWAVHVDVDDWWACFINGNPVVGPDSGGGDFNIVIPAGTVRVQVLSRDNYNGNAYFGLYQRSQQDLVDFTNSWWIPTTQFY